MEKMKVAVAVKAKPTSPGRRFVTTIKRGYLHKGKPYAPLVSGGVKTATPGRNNAGRITTRHRKRGAKSLYRTIDFKRQKEGIPAKVERLEYDPNRSAEIALLLYADGERRYIIAPDGLRVGDHVVSGPESAIKVGNCLPIESIPLGTIIHGVELKPFKGAQLARSAGTSVQLIAKEGDYAMLRLRSGEIRKVLTQCRAVIGSVSHPKHNLRSLGKAGAASWRGRRSTVRGVAMNPVDHPHGGGEGRTSGGGHPRSPWGWQTKGLKTRKNKWTNYLIVRKRSERKKR